MSRTIAARAAVTATRLAGLTTTLLAGLIPGAAQIATSLPTPIQTTSAITLSPFEVNTTKDTGFAAANAGTATRLTLDMRDVPAAFSVMTSEFIDALAIVNVGEAASWMPNGSTIEPQDNVQQPMQYNTRGVNNNLGPIFSGD